MSPVYHDIILVKEIREVVSTFIAFDPSPHANEIRSIYT